MTYMTPQTESDRAIFPNDIERKLTKVEFCVFKSWENIICKTIKMILSTLKFPAKTAWKEESEVGLVTSLNFFFAAGRGGFHMNDIWHVRRELQRW